MGKGVVFTVVAAAAAAGAVAMRTTSVLTRSAPVSTRTVEADMRVLGKVAATTSEFEGGVVHTVFKCESPRQAEMLVSKWTADATGFGDARVDAADARVVRLPDGGVFLAGTAGSAAAVIYAPPGAKLPSKARKLAAAAPKCYPHWFDRFDNAALAMGNLGWGVLPQDYRWGMERTGRKGWEYIVDNGSPNISAAPGVWDFTIRDFFAVWARKYGVGYFIYPPWAAPQNPSWFWNEEPLPYTRGVKGYVAHPSLDYQHLAAHSPFVPLANRRARGFLDAFNRDYAGLVSSDDLFTTHFGTVEMGHLFALSVPGVDDGVTHTMREVVGDGDCDLDLRGTWRLRMPSGEERDVDCNDPAILVFAAKAIDTELTRRFTVRAPEFAARRYLHVSRNNWHGGKSRVPEVKVNGRPARNLTQDDVLCGDYDCCFDLDGLLADGENSIAINTRGQPIPHYVFLSGRGRFAYPCDEPARNKLFFDLVEYCANRQVEGIASWLRAIRAGDPSGRPLQAMAPWDVIDKTFGLFREVGAYGHETGMGQGCFAPWMARYYQSRDLPVSSENGGVPNDAFGFKMMMTHYTVMGNDACNWLFDPTAYRDNGIAEWVDSHVESLRCLGKLEFGRAQVGVMRSVRDASRLNQPNQWWADPSRGPLQRAGRTCALCDPVDMVSGEAGRMFDVVVDAECTLLSEEEVAGIARFVEAGGVFVAAPNTGEHSPYVKGANLLHRRLAAGEPAEQDGMWKVWNVGKGRFICRGREFNLAAALDRLGVPRTSMGEAAEGCRELFCEVWRSKNGLYDLYMAADMSRDKSAKASPVFFTTNAPSRLVELSAEGHPQFDGFKFADGRLTLAGLEFEPMQFRLFGALRPDAGASPADWLKSLEKRWYALPPQPRAAAPSARSEFKNYLPLVEGWTHVGSGRKVRLGSYLAMGIEDEESDQFFVREVEVPAAWSGRDVRLNFECKYWFWGLYPRVTVKVDGKALPGLEKAGERPNNSFTFRLPSGTSKFTLGVDVFGGLPPGHGRHRPTGVTGVFFLEALEPSAEDVAIEGFGSFGPLLETRFDSPRNGGRWYLETDGELGWVILNGTMLQVPSYIDHLDVTRLLAPAGKENLLRWWPSGAERPKGDREPPKKIPRLWLSRRGAAVSEAR